MIVKVGVVRVNCVLLTEVGLPQPKNLTHELVIVQVVSQSYSLKGLFKSHEVLCC